MCDLQWYVKLRAIMAIGLLVITKISLKIRHCHGESLVKIN